MPLNKCAALALAVLVTLTAPTRAEDTRAFIYGNSLMNHVSGSDETTVPHWLRLLAEAGGQSFAASGVFGSGPEFAGNLPPEPNWSFAEVPQAWDSDRLAFRRAGFDTVILNIRNFIQDEAPDAPYAWDNPDGQSPLSTTLRIFDWTAFQAPDARFYIYEGWSDMSLIADSFPPSDRWQLLPALLHVDFGPQSIVVFLRFAHECINIIRGIGHILRRRRRGERFDLLSIFFW